MKACEVAVFECMGLKEGETLLIIADEPSREIGYALWEAGKSRGNEVVFVEIIPRRMHGEEPPSSVAELMKLFDVCLIPTSKSMSHTRARKEACKAGTRIATLPGITMDMMERTLAADYKKIEKVSKEI
ncbi:aminopeptidase, partial [bacterium]